MTVGSRPAISVFTAAHEIGAGLERPARSVLAQTLGDWEWVIADDSSGPETFAAAQRIASAPESAGRIRPLKIAPQRSIGASKRAAAGACHGRILVELDHDDELDPHALESVLAAFEERPDIDFLYSDWVDVVEGVETAAYPAGWAFGLGAYATEIRAGRRVPVALAPIIDWDAVRHLAAMPNHLRAWRAGFYREIGGHDPAIRIGDDYELLVRTFLAGRVARVPRPLYRQHRDRDRPSASLAHNAEIQAVVAAEAARRERELDARCLELGAIPAGPHPLVSDEPLPAANLILDPEALACERRGEPLVSVVIPTRDRPRQLEQAIESVLAQSYSRLEALVVGNACGSVDDVIGAIGDPRVRHWNLGPEHTEIGAAARNYALKTMARGTVIAYLDDDNRWEPDHLESLVEALTRTGAAYAFSSFRIAGEEFRCSRPIRYRIDTSAIAHRRELLERYGYWRLLPRGYAEDWELVSRWRQERWAATERATLDYTFDPRRHRPELLEAIRAAA